MADKKVSYWSAGDWNGFFGLGTNVLVNIMVLTRISQIDNNFTYFGRRF